MIIVTGTGRSGTSVTAKILKESGLSIGRPKDLQWYENISAGLEDKLTVDINKHLIRNDAGTHKYDKRTSYLLAPMMKGVAEHYEVVKDPRFVFTLEAWLQSGAQIDLVIICMRSYSEVLRSARESNAGIEGAKDMTDEKIWDEFTKRIGRILYWCNIYNVKYKILRYEHYVDDFPYFLGVKKELVNELFNEKSINSIRSEDTGGSEQSNTETEKPSI